MEAKSTETECELQQSGMRFILPILAVGFAGLTASCAIAIFALMPWIAFAGCFSSVAIAMISAVVKLR